MLPREWNLFCPAVSQKSTITFSPLRTFNFFVIKAAWIVDKWLGSNVLWAYLTHRLVLPLLQIFKLKECFKTTGLIEIYYFDRSQTDSNFVSIVENLVLCATFAQDNNFQVFHIFRNYDLEWNNLSNLKWWLWKVEWISAKVKLSLFSSFITLYNKIY